MMKKLSILAVLLVIILTGCKKEEQQCYECLVSGISQTTAQHEDWWEDNCSVMTADQYQQYYLDKYSSQYVPSTINSFCKLK